MEKDGFTIDLDPINFLNVSDEYFYAYQYREGGRILYEGRNTTTLHIDPFLSSSEEEHFQRVREGLAEYLGRHPEEVQGKKSVYEVSPQLQEFVWVSSSKMYGVVLGEGIGAEDGRKYTDREWESLKAECQREGLGQVMEFQEAPHRQIRFSYQAVSGHFDLSGAVPEGRRRLFVDMDGTLAVFHPADSLEGLYEEGYFRGLEPMPGPLQAVKKIIREQPGTEVYILSAVLTDSKYALEEKNAWLDLYLPEIPKERRIFTPCGVEKSAYIPGGVRPEDWLLDDYTHNLMQWSPPGHGIKLLNGINHTRGTWKGDCIWHKKDSAILAQNMADIMAGKAQVRDHGPEPGRAQNKEAVLRP